MSRRKSSRCMRMRPSLASATCFLSSSSALLRRLLRLELHGCRNVQLDSGELCRHFYSLQQLTALRIAGCCSQRLDAFTLADFTPPWSQVRMPKLKLSNIICMDPEEEE